MRRWTAALLVVLTACARAPTSAAPLPTTHTTPTSAPTLAPTAVPADAGFALAPVMADVRTLSVDIGRREAGTPGDSRSADFIASRMAAADLRVTRQIFPLPQG